MLSLKRFIAFGASVLSAVASPSSVSGSSGTPGTVTSDAATCDGTPGGGTFAWSRVSGSTSIIATSSALATTTFQANMTENGTINAVFKCTYTRGGESVDSNNVSVQLTLL